MQTIPRLLQRLDCDMHNHCSRANPWTLAAQSMARTWDNILRSGWRRSNKRRNAAPPTDWPSAAMLMLKHLRERVQIHRHRVGWRQRVSNWATQSARSPLRLAPRTSRPTEDGPANGPAAGSEHPR